MYEQNTEHQQWLEAGIAALDAAAGTIHIQRGDDLFLTAAKNIPPPVIATVAHVVHGKGMAGSAQVRKERFKPAICKTIIAAISVPVPKLSAHRQRLLFPY